MPYPRLYANETVRRQAEYLRKKARKLANREVDPLYRLIPTELAYIAGIVDGEGCIRIGRVGPKKLTLYLIVAVAMTNHDVIAWLQQKFSSGTIKVNNHTKLHENPNWKVQYVVRMHGRRARLLCELIHPYLIVKRQQADIALQFPCDCRVGPGVFLQQSVIQLREELSSRMAKLNKRGPNA